MAGSEAAATVRLPVVRTIVAAARRRRPGGRAPGSARTAWGRPARTRSCGSACGRAWSSAGGGRRRDGRADAAGASTVAVRRVRDPPRTSSCRTTRPAPRSTTTGTCAAGGYSHGPVHDLAWQMELDAATTWLDRLPLRRRDRRAGGGDRLVVGAAGDEGRAARLRRGRRRRWTGRATGWSRTACAPTSTSATRGRRPTAPSTPFCRVLAEPRAPGAAGCVPRHRPRLAEARGRCSPRSTRSPIPRRVPVDRLPAAGPGPVAAPARRRPRVHDPEGPLRARRAGGDALGAAGFARSTSAGRAGASSSWRARRPLDGRGITRGGGSGRRR